MIESPEGILVNADSGTLEVYKELKKFNIDILENSGMLWNWPLVSTLTRPTIARILWLSEIYELILPVPGSILEFGVHFGTSSTLLTNLRAIFEPLNYNREHFIFDTFNGFIGSTEADGIRGGDGKFSLPVSYEENLDALLSLHKQLNPIPQQINHKIYAGDASSTVKIFLEENPQTVIGLAIFDMDIYKPTRDALESIVPRLTKGSIIVFDQFNFAGYPGETMAVQEVFGFNNLKLNRSKFMPHCAWARFGD